MNDYYDAHAERFFRETTDVDMATLYAPFLEVMPPGARILDAGCGSGRDSLAFMQHGYHVEAFDASPAMAALASRHLGQNVHVRRFDEVDWVARFDGIWACASLLHVRWANLPDALGRLALALKPGGLLYASFKYGRGEREDRGRWFTDLDETRADRLLVRVPVLRRKHSWITNDRRPEKANRQWLNLLFVRTADPAYPQSPTTQ